MLSRSGSTVELAAPATVGNVGPGFDVASLALGGLGDRIEVTPAEADRLVVTGPGAEGVPEAWSKNVAGRCLDRLRATTGIETGYEVRLEKPRRCGSGLGSSASSAAGVALAFHALNPDAGLSARALVREAGYADAHEGTPHFDDVAAVVLGGVALVDPATEGLSVSRVAPPERLRLAIAIPDLVRETAKMRAVLPENVPRVDAVANLAALARLIDACHRDDVEAVGASMRDRIATPHRAKHLPFFEATRTAGLEAGALGAALAGSGPAVFGVVDDEAVGRRVAEAMVQAVRESGVDCKALVAAPEQEVPYDVASMR